METETVISGQVLAQEL